MTRILIVDDHAENLYFLRMLFSGQGYAVDEARHGAEALTKARQTPPDLVISDLLMPVLDGYTLLRLWKDDEQFKRIPFVVYTATYTDPKDERLALDLGADAFIVKPSEPEIFMDRIRKILAEEEYARPKTDAEYQAEPGALLKEYNQTLIRKLEKKARELEQANKNLLAEIEERKKTEVSLRDSEDRYHKLFDAITDPLFVYDRETLRYLAVNEAAVAKYGYSYDEFMEMTIKDIRPEEDVPGLLDMLKNSGTAIESRGIWRHRKKSGEIIEVDIFAYGLTFSGRPACVVQACDVTEKRRAEAEAARNSELLQAVVNGTPDIVYIKDLKGKYLLFNEAAARYVGKSVIDVLGKDDTELFSPEDARHVMESDRLVIETEQNHAVEDVLDTAQGLCVFQSIKVPYRNANGKVIGVIGISRDVTESKKIEKTLHLRDRAIEAVSQGILITDPNQPDNPIIYVSNGFERMTGYSEENVLGKNCRFLQGRETNPETVTELRDAVLNGRGCQVEILNYRQDGTEFWNHLTISPVLDNQGKLTHFVGVQTDVTEKRQLEAQFRQAQKMEAFGQLAGGVAHDFNNLLTIISGYSEVILSKIPSADPLRDLAEAIHEAGESATALTSQLLAFSRKTILAPKVLNVNTIVSQTEKMLKRLIGEDIVLVTALCPQAHLVRVDPGHLGQVLMNLAVNARDAMPKGGKMTIETANVTLDQSHTAMHSEAEPGSYVMLTVSDTGSGISDEVKARIFEPFFTTKGVGAGTGLGLAVVHGIIKQSDGLIEVDSKVGAGTTFKIYFPAVKDQPEAEKADTPRQARSGDETILLVEDDSGVRTLTTRILKMNGYKVLSARHGEEALEIAAEQGNNISLLISDVVMPGMGGVELTKTLLTRFPKIKVLFLSGYTNDAVVRHGILHDEVAFLQKPFSPGALADKIRAILDEPASQS